LTTALSAVAVIATAAPAYAQDDLGVFVQLGYVKATAFDVGTNGDYFGQQGSLSGVLVGVGVGGNKSGKVGFGADVNYMARDGQLVFGELKTHYLNVPVYARFNFMGYDSRDAAQAYALAGAALDFLMSSKLNGTDVSERFSSFAPGIMFGGGFEARRFGFEMRVTFSIRTLKEDEDGDIWMGLSDFRQASVLFLFKYRLR
jgi:hypothetical protein